MWKYHHHPFINNFRPLVMAHRGDSANIPENTIQAFEDAYQLQVDCIETDVHMTTDEEFVLFHDPELDRTTNGTGKIADRTLEELKTLDAGYWFTIDEGHSYPFRSQGLKIHTLDEIIPMFPNVRFNLDIKSTHPNAPKKLAEKLKVLDIEKQVMVGSFHRKQIQKFRKYSEAVSSAGPREVLLFWFKSKFWIKKIKKLPEEQQIPKSESEILKNQLNVFKKELPFKALQIPMRFSILKLVKPSFIQFAHYLGIAIQIWTINDRKTMEKLLQWNVDGIFSDKPRLLLETSKAFFSDFDDFKPE